MTMRLLLAACLLAGAASQSIGTCGDYTSGTCAWLGCSSSRGPTNCVEGKCICQTGYCSTGDACECDPETGGTCSFFSCSGSRGPTDCIKSKCFCKPGTCAVDGVCMENDHSAKKSRNMTLALPAATKEESKLSEDEDIWRYHPHATPFEVFVSLMVGFGLPIAVAVWVIKKFGDGTPVDPVDAREPEADFAPLLG
mmetsp:Transcript_7976/g.13914  ORF Transcript_7976/g.13914 Transcript_7976/m.13914 type:complete len:196 (-) Transcript_7976:164-751(-)